LHTYCNTEIGKQAAFCLLYGISAEYGCCNFISHTFTETHCNIQ